MTFRSSFDVRDDLPQFYDPVPFNYPISSTGKYMVIHRGQGQGVLYYIDEELEFHSVKTFLDGCSGGGFTKDETYFFTTTGFYPIIYPAKGEKIRLEAYRLDGASLDLVASEDIPSTAALMWDINVTSQDELLGSGSWLIPPNYYSYAAYQFDRMSETLTLTHYDTENSMVGVLSHDESFFLGFAAKKIRTYVRGGEENLFQLHSAYWNPDWAYTYARYVRLTPDSKFALVPLLSRDGDSGAAVFGFTPDKSLYLNHFHPEGELDQIAVSPDGRLVAASHHSSSATKYLSIYRLTDDGRLIETARYGRSNWIFGLEFLPQARPTSADPAVWSQYSKDDTNEPPTVRTVPFPKPDKTVASVSIYEQRED